MDLDEYYLPDFKLDHVADVARPESPEARHFNKAVDKYLETGDPELNKEIVAQLKEWSRINNDLRPFMEGNDKLQEIDSLSFVFSNLSKVIIGLESGVKLTEEEMQIISAKLDFLEIGG